MGASLVFDQSRFLRATIHRVDAKNLDLNLLLSLEALLAERSVTRAAARLGLSQPALSARLARLRDLFGDPLLLPAQRGLTPTARALELEAPLREALDGLRGVVAKQSKFDPMRSRMTVSISASDYVHYVALLPFVLALRRAAPLIRVALRPLDRPRVGNQMAAAEVDLVLMMPGSANEELRSRVLFQERYVCIARADHPKIRRRLTLDEFCALEHVVVSPQGGGFVGPTDRVLAANGRERKVVLSAAHFLFVPEIVARSDLLALVPARMVREPGSRIRVFEPPIGVEGFQIAMFWHDKTHAHPRHRWIREQLASSVAQQQ